MQYSVKGSDSNMLLVVLGCWTSGFVHHSKQNVQSGRK